MRPTRTAVTSKRSIGRRLAVGCSSMLLVSLFLAIEAAEAQTEPPFFLVYGVPRGSGAVDPGSYPQNADGMPLIPPVLVQIGAPPVDIDVFFHNWASAPVASTSPCNPDPEASGADVAGHEVCGWHALLVANNGLQITGFTPASGDVEHSLTDDPEGDSLNVTGGTPLAPPGGAAVQIGRIKVSASEVNQSLEARPGGAQSVAFVSAALTARAAPVSIIAGSLNTCGDSTTLNQPPEECDDGNTASGDACYRNCQNEAGASLEGTATASGDVEVEVEAVNLVIPTAFNESAEQVIEKIVEFVNLNSELAALGVSAEQVDSPGERFVTDGALGTLTSNTPGLTFVPEPSGWLMLATGVGFLASVGRRRFVR